MVRMAFVDFSCCTLDVRCCSLILMDDSDVEVVEEDEC